MAKQAKSTKPARRGAAGHTAENVWLWGGILVALVLFVYWPTLDNTYIWDDGQHVLNNPVLRTGQGLVDLWIKPRSIPQYYPLVHTSFWLEYRFWGTNPHGYHAVNMALHAVAALLLWRVLARLQLPGSWFAAALFAVHPIYVESVAWITERKNVLSLVFALGSMWAFLRFMPAQRDDKQSVDAGPVEWRFYALSCGLFVCALLSKTVTASLPAVLLVVYWWKLGRLPLKLVGLLAPFFVVGGLLASVTVRIERTHVGAEGAEWDFSVLERILIAGRAVWFYAGKVVWPHPLVFFYPRWTIDPRLWWQWIFPLAAIGLVVALWLLRGRIGRGPLAAALIFGGVLVPALGFFNVYPFRYSFVADHFQYHASIALVALFAALAVGATSFVGRTVAWFPMAGAAALLAVLALVAQQQTTVYHDVRTLYEHTLAWNPTCWAARSNLAYYWMNQGQYDLAIAEYERALESAPATERWLAHVNIGNCLQAQGKLNEALAQYEQAMQVATPETIAVVHTHLAGALVELARYSEALAHYDEAQQLNPEVMNTSTRVNRALCLEQLGQHAQAAQAFSEVIALDPQVEPNVYLRAADCWEQSGQYEKAAAYYLYVVRAMPNAVPVRNRLASVLLRLGHLDQAGQLLRETLASSPAGAERQEAQRLWQQLIEQQGERGEPNR